MRKLQNRLTRKKLKCLQLETLDKKTLDTYTEETEKIEALSDTFEQLPKHKPPVSAHSIIQTILQSKPFTRHRIFKRNHERHNTFIFIKFRGKQ